MLLRPRPDGRASADRVAGLLAPVRGGWVPPEPEWSLRADLDEEDDGPECSEDDDEGPARLGEDDAGPARSWAPGRHAVNGPGAARWRLDPGRGGAAALLVVAVLAAVVAAGVVQRGRPQPVSAPQVEAVGEPLPGASTPAPAATPPSGAAAVPPTGGPAGEVVVSVAGRVRRPGLVRLPAGSRVDDAVRAAGGPVDPAAAGLLNLARRLVDGEQVLVGIEPPPGAAGVPGGPGGRGGVVDPAAGVDGGAGPGLVDLNSATVADLDALPGIGPVLAQRIVDWRSENGRFASVDQLREVTGIGEAKFEDLRTKVAV